MRAWLFCGLPNKTRKRGAARAGCRLLEAWLSRHSRLSLEPFVSFTAATSEATLEFLFGRENVERSEIGIGEGVTVPGTIVYPGIPEQRLEVVWQSDRRSSPRELRLRGESSLWATEGGLSLGSTLKEIENLNGWPFRLTGFGFDYSGTITDRGEGRLTFLGRLDPADRARRTFQRSVVVRLLPDQGISEDYQQVIGDREFSSGHPAMQALNPRVYQMIVFFSQ